MTRTTLRPADNPAGLTDLEHGTLTAYKIRLCRCERCTRANTDYVNRRNRLIAYGQWKPLVDAQPAREHVQALQTAGLGWRRVAALAGVTPNVVCKLLYGAAYRGQEPTRRVKPEIAAALLAVQADLDALADGALQDACGTRRRLQALVACGWSQARLAHALGMAPANFGSLLQRDQVTAGTARHVRALYGQLWDVAPPEDTHHEKVAASRARNHAAAHGWTVPAGWDDDLIDLPEADLQAEIARQVAAMSPQERARCYSAYRNHGDRTPTITAAASAHRHHTDSLRKAAS